MLSRIVGICKIKHILSVIHYTICGAVCFQFTHFPCDDWENIYTLSYYHHQIGYMNYCPLFRVTSWNNGMRCMYFYVLVNKANVQKVKIQSAHIWCSKYIISHSINYTKSTENYPKTNPIRWCLCRNTHNLAYTSCMLHNRMCIKSPWNIILAYVIHYQAIWTCVVFMILIFVRWYDTCMYTFSCYIYVMWLYCEMHICRDPSDKQSTTTTSCKVNNGSCTLNVVLHGVPHLDGV